MAQNTSYAVMAQKHDRKDTVEFYPTPPWATRALCEHVKHISGDSVWEPACGQGHMAKPLKEYFKSVYSSDIHDYGYGDVLDFLSVNAKNGVNWIITNPPFNQAEQFIKNGLKIATKGVAVLVRTSFLEGVRRHRLFSSHPPSIVAQFAERVPMVKGRLDRTASTATSYCWIVWRKGLYGTRLVWIPPCRKQLERDSDY